MVIFGSAPARINDSAVLAAEREAIAPSRDLQEYSIESFRQSDAFTRSCNLSLERQHCKSSGGCLSAPIIVDQSFHNAAPLPPELL